MLAMFFWIFFDFGASPDASWYVLIPKQVCSVLGPITGSRKLQAFRVDCISRVCSPSWTWLAWGFCQSPSEIGKNAIFFEKSVLCIALWSTKRRIWLYKLVQVGAEKAPKKIPIKQIRYFFKKDRYKRSKSRNWLFWPYTWSERPSTHRRVASGRPEGMYTTTTLSYFKNFKFGVQNTKVTVIFKTNDRYKCTKSPKWAILTQIMKRAALRVAEGRKQSTRRDVHHTLLQKIKFGVQNTKVTAICLNVQK